MRWRTTNKGEKKTIALSFQSLAVMAKASGRPRRTSSSSSHARQWSPLTLATLRNIRERPRQKCHTRKPGSTVCYRDQSDHGYGWLLPGWVAEERRMLTGRLYTYYYDRWGRQYKTKREVLYRWALCGLVLLE